MDSLNLVTLLDLIDEIPACSGLIKDIISGKKGSITVKLLDAARSFFVAALYHNLKRPLLVIAAHPENTKRLYEQISLWCRGDSVMLFPEPDGLPYERISSDTPTESEKLQVMTALAGYDGKNSPPLIIASASSLAQKITGYDSFKETFHELRQGMTIDPYRLLRKWENMGYEPENMVEVPGTMSHRGGILDIYPPTSVFPVRLEFFGNTIESIRLFDPTTQRSQKEVPLIIIGTATELLEPLQGDNLTIEGLLEKIDLFPCTAEVKEQYQNEVAMLVNKQKFAYNLLYAPLFNHASIMDYLPRDTLVVFNEPLSIQRVLEQYDIKGEELRNSKLERGELAGGFPRPYFTWDELAPVFQEKQKLMFTTWDSPGERDYDLDFTPAPIYAGQIEAFIQKVKTLLDESNRVILVSHQSSRLAEMLEEQDIMAVPVVKVEETPPPGSLTLLQGLMAEGWVMNNDTYLLTDTEIFGFTKQRRLLKKRPVPKHKLFIDIKPGDHVVHVEHGIGKFAGFRTMTTGSIKREYLVLTYAEGDRLYVPVDQVDRVARYVGSGERTPVLSRLGTQEWTRAKQKVKESVEQMAEELLSLYASREIVPGFAFSRDTVWQHELEASFPYVETPDQIEVQKQVKEDMEKIQPMDRLICGDVGYGKTEVAIRATFKAVMGGKQVAVLVPTTVLAQQHFSTFSERMEAFPIKIEALSRFRSHKEQEEILEGLANGNVDIVIGTHRLLQKDVVFKELGLLVIDEEQRFGVVHKEFLKKIRQEVDVLTLSATPIPRTLHMSLVGVRDMSTMETPPEDRLPVRTFVAEYDEQLIREAILREIERNGQVFFVHNRVQSIAIIAEKIRVMVPEARVSIAHGQMAEEQLERIISDFINGKSDILVCTTIIESGLDMPNVNTLIINLADKFGLTQLYQLRGRVGRGSNLAYAYFLFDKGKSLTAIAEKRLRTIYEATELGAGFGIAMKDLEIRGAGTILGARQSGHISVVGFHLYSQLLANAVEKLKAIRAGVPMEQIQQYKLPPPSVELPLQSYIPEEYVPDMETRLDLYQRLANIKNIKQVGEMTKEFVDRFGTLPVEVENLLYVVKIKLLAHKAGLESISVEQRELVLRLYEGMSFKKKKLGNFIRDGIKIGNTRLTLNPRRFGKQWQNVLEDVLSAAA